MRKNLPIYETNSIFVRGSEQIQSHQQALITGSEDTPYAFGCFLFDILYPE
jgi:ubiquitin-protein ligase